TAQTVTVTPVNDDEADGNITYTIVTSNAVSSDPGYNNYNVDDVTVTNNDDDHADFTFNSTSGLITTEAGVTASFKVRLTSKPTGNVTFSLTSSDISEGTVSPSSLTFTPSNWNTDQVVTITGVDDYVADGDISYSIVTGVVSSTDANYNGKNPADVSVTNTDNDVAGFTVTPTAGLITKEAGDGDTFKIRLKSQPLSDVTVALSSSNTSEGLVSPTSVTFTSTNWNTDQTVTVTGVDDDIDDGDVAYQIITNPATSSDPAYSGKNPADVSVTNIDDDEAKIIVNPVGGLTTSEAGKTDLFKVVLQTRPTANVILTLYSSNTNEGTISASSLTFTPSNWNLQQEVVITGVDDDIDDDNVVYTIITNAATSSDAKYNGYNPSDVSVTNTDNDEAGFTVTQNTGLTTTEAGGTATFKIKLKTRPIASVTIGISSSNTNEGTVSPSSLVFNSTNWNVDQIVTIKGVDDYVDDGDVVYTIITAAAVSSDPKYNGKDPENVTVTNTDNDEAGVTITPSVGLYTTEAGDTTSFKVRLNTQPLSSVQMTFVSSNSSEGTVSPNTLTFTTTNWNSYQKVTITGVNDDVDDDDQAYIIETQPCVSSDPKYDNYNPVDVSVTNRDDDQAGYNVSNTSISYSEGDVPVEVTFSLKSKPTADVQFAVSSDNSSKGTVAPAGLTFTQSNWSVPQTVTITPVNNSIVDGDILFNVVTDLPTTTDAKYAGLNPPDIAVTCTDDDVAGITVSTISGNTSEDGTTAEFMVVLTSEPTDDVTIPITSLNTSEGTVSPASLTFTVADWSTPQTVTVTGEDDAAVDGNQTFTVEVGAATSTDTIYDGYNPDDVTVINIDDDQAGVNVFPTSGLVTSEAGDTDTFQMSLNTIPTDDVSVTFTSTNTSEGTVSPTTHVFTSANWNSPVIVTLTGVDDLIADGDQVYSISITTSSSDANYNLMTIDPVSAINMDDTIPRAVDDVAITDEDTQKNIDVLLNDLGLDAGGLTVTIASNPSNGTVNVESDNTITYTPDGIFNGDDVFTYRVTDANGAYDEASVTVTVTFVDDQPVAVDDSRGTSMNTPRVIDVLFNDSGLEDGGIVVSIDTQADPAKGEAVANADNTVTFTPAPDYMGIATFKYKVTDNDGDFATATVTVNVREINHIPDAVDDNALTYVDTDVTVNVLSNDSGLDDGFKDITIHADPANGSVVVNADRTVTYTPNAGFSGTDSFIYLLEDIDGDYDVATVTITVTAKPDFHPVANDDRRGTSLDTPVTVDVLLNDTGLDDGLASMSITTLPVNGSATVNADNTITYTPNAGYYGTEIFGYQICDTDGDCDAANVIVTVKNGVNYVPVANDDKDSTYLNTPVTINVMENDSGLEDGFDSLEIFEEPQFGTVVVNADRTVTYTPTYMFIGEETFKYIITDVDGDYGIATVTVKVYEKPNFIPVANDDRRGCSFNTAVNVDVLFNDTNLDDVPVTVTVSEAPAQGNASVNSDNTVTFTPAPDFVGIMTFRYTVTDADGDSDDAMVSINVKSGENVVPSAVADEATTIVNTPVTINVLANDEGLDDGFNDLQVYSQPQFGTVIVNADRTVTYTPSYMFIGTETFRYYIEDVDGDYSLATVTVSVIERPDYHPTANDDARGCSFNSSVIIDVLENDENINDTPLTLAFTIPPSIGSAVINADNTVTFTSDNDYVGVVTFGYSVTDADGDSDDAQVVVTVKPGENNVPVAQDDNAQTLVNTPVDVNILANDRGLEDGFGEIYIKQQPSFGSVVINANRTVTYFPGYMFIGSDSFTYKLTDVDGDYSVATVTITVIDKPDYQPVANDDARGCSFNSAVTVDVLANDTGLDDTPVTVSINLLPSSGGAVVNPDNTVTFTPATNFTGIMTFGYTVTDADGDSDNALVTINVKEGENIVPVAVDDAASTLINQSVVINVLANDSGLEDGFDELTIFEQPQFGSVVVNANRTVTYTPSYMFVGTETFRYKIIDLDGDYAMATVTVTVTDRPNYVPVANDDRRGCSFNQSVKIDVLFNDKNLDDIPIAVSIAENPLSGSVVVNSDNTVTFTPSTDFIGFMTFRYAVTDVDGDSDDAQVTVNVKEGENYWPTANDDVASTIVNKSVDINVLANDSGLDDGLERLLIQSSPQFGSVIINENNTITYTPSYMFLGTDSFEYLVEDVDGDYSVATVTVTVTERGNAQPVANDDYRGTAINTARIVDVLVNDTGLDDEPIVVTVKSLPQNGSAVVNVDNTITYTPSSNYLGMDSLEYTVTDVDGDFDNAYAFINVKPVNMIPVASDDYVETYVNTAVDIHILDNDTLLYEGIKSVQIHAAPIWGTATVNADYTVTYTPSYFYVGNDEFKYIVEDVDGDYAMATVYVSVIPKPNSIPVANDDSRGTSINMAVVVDVLLNDDGLDDTPVGVYIKDKPDVATGSATVNLDNTVTFTPATDYLGKAAFTYFIVDNNNDTSNVANVNINVKEVNFIPIANPDTAETVMNLPVLIDVINNDTNLDDGLSYFKIFNKPLHGFAYVFDNSNIRYIPSSWFVGTDSLEYIVYDTDGDYGIAKVYITVKERPDHKPVAMPDGRGTIIDNPVSVDVLFNDKGLEDGGIVVLVNSSPLNGSVIVNADNTVTYTPKTGYYGEDVFYYQVCDFDSDCSSAAVTINVKTTNAVPIANNDVITTYKNRAVSIDVLFNDQNKTDGGISVSVLENPANGSASVNADYTIEYTPTTDFFGSDSLKYYLKDIDGDYDIATVYITVLNRENYTPSAQDDDYETYINVTILCDVLTNDTGLDDGVKSLEVETAPTNGLCTITNDLKIQYSPLNGFKGSDTFTYKVTDTDDEASVAYVTVTVNADPNKKIDIPEAFSPNGDDINDTFEILNIEQYQRIKLKVYNRWGNLVYKNDNYTNNWDGSANVSMAIGTRLPAGTYYYLIEIVDNGKMYKGSVFIKR
ncbi:MAG TPA: Ig-like domain-containing protein, partial [Tenuifilaceae bacterium]|nr:Ig-like domain-containing protein [Tenuifilaceae bacterium]